MNRTKYVKLKCVALTLMLLGLSNVQAQSASISRNNNGQYVEDVDTLSSYKSQGIRHVQYTNGDASYGSVNSVGQRAHQGTYGTRPSLGGTDNHYNPSIQLQYERDPSGLMHQVEVEPLTEGRALVRVQATRRAQVKVSVDTHGRTFVLQEVSPGVYEGLVSGIDPYRNVYVSTTATKNNMQAQMVHALIPNIPLVDQALVDQGYDPRYEPHRPPVHHHPLMVQYGTVESVIQMHKQVHDGSGNVAGTVLGGVVGGVLGNQVGGGSGKDIATVLGVLGGAYAGNQISKNQGAPGTTLVPFWRVNVRMSDGSLRSIDYDQPIELLYGQKVVVRGNQIQPVR